MGKMILSVSTGEKKGSSAVDKNLPFWASVSKIHACFVNHASIQKDACRCLVLGFQDKFGCMLQKRKQLFSVVLGEAGTSEFVGSRVLTSVLDV